MDKRQWRGIEEFGFLDSAGNASTKDDCVLCKNCNRERGVMVSCKRFPNDTVAELQEVNKTSMDRCEDFVPDYAGVAEVLKALDRKFMSLCDVAFPSDDKSKHGYSQEQYDEHIRPFVVMFMAMKAWCYDQAMYESEGR